MFFSSFPVWIFELVVGVLRRKFFFSVINVPGS